MKRAAVMMALVASLGVAPGRAAAAGCAATTAQANTKCSFIASGTVQYATDGASSWYIQVFRGGAFFAQREGDAGLPQTGTIETVAGDTVVVGLSAGALGTGPGTAGGVVIAGSDLPAAFPGVKHGCTAAGYNPNISSIQCRYLAEGPGAWVAATTWPYLIKASSDGGATWRNLVYEPRFGHPGSGALATLPGDLVTLSISCWNGGAACVSGYNPFTHTNYYEGSRAGALIAADA